MMTKGGERPVWYDCEGEAVLGILHNDHDAPDMGFVIIVGGPQYRVGSHRMFVQWARRFAAEGFAALRFDCRGMGDSGGQFPGFERLDPDVRSAVDCLAAACPTLSRIALVGLCDGATAAAIYAHTDPRVTDLVLLNPWVHTEQTEAKTYLWHYYPRRLMQADFWRSLWSGNVRVVKSALDLARNIGATVGKSIGERSCHDEHYIDRMRHGLLGFNGNTLVLTSERDMVATEFLGFLDGHDDWQPVRDRITLTQIPGSDHTLSDKSAMDAFVSLTLDWIRSAPGRVQ